MSRLAPRVRRVVPVLLSAAVGLGAGFVLAPLGRATTAEASTRADSTWVWSLPKGFPVPRVPTDNPMTPAKVALGRHLFYDTRLSGNGTFSCASCHLQAKAFSDGKGRAVGSTGQVHPRGSMSLANVAYLPVLTWANPNMKRLEQQALVPMFGETPVELGLAGKEGELLARLKAEPRYGPLFAAAFPGDPAPVTLNRITQALASFQRTLISGQSAFDRARAGDSAAMSPAARRGESLFFSEKLECFHCHGGFNFTQTADYVGKGFAEVEFHNTGLYNVRGTGRYPATAPGVREFTQDEDDDGKFRAPSLRNIAVTAPYMHDGSIATLDEVLRHYAAGGRTLTHGPNRGVGSDNPNKSEFVRGFRLSARERRDVVAFLEALTDSAFLKDPRFSNPWVR
jgi:cytochrome c peroxidase